MKHSLNYLRTRHIIGARLVPGDEDLNAIPFAAIADRHGVVEKKVDGANTGIAFDEDGALWLISVYVTVVSPGFLLAAMT